MRCALVISGDTSQCSTCYLRWDTNDRPPPCPWDGTGLYDRQLIVSWLMDKSARAIESEGRRMSYRYRDLAQSIAEGDHVPVETT